MRDITILIVEDDADVRRGLEIRLVGHGFNVVAAGDVLAAINQATLHRPNLAILDVRLPTGNGILLIHRLRSIPGLEELPVIILTANNPSLLEDEARRHGAQKFLSKPVDNAVLFTSVHGVLAGQAGAAAP